MKKLYLTLLCMLSAYALKAQSEMSSQITYISGNDNNILVEVTAQANEKKDVESTACKSVINAYLLMGIEGVGTGLPVIDETDMDRHPDYFRSLFGTRYTVYANNPKKISGPKKNMAGVYEGTYRVLFRKTAFDKDLCAYNIVDCGKTPVELPTIMVVPFRKNGQTYREILDRNPYMRIAISKVQTAFRQAGYTTIDFIAKLDAAERHTIITSDNADSFAAQLIRNSGADIYVSVDFSTKESYRNNHVALALKAYYCANGNITASGTSSFDGDMSIDRCCIGAVHKVMADFLRQIKWPPSKVESKLTVGVAAESMINLESEIGNNGATVAEEVRAWVKKNARAFHQQGLSDTEIIFDSITLPIDCDSTDFAIKLAQYLRRKGVSAKYTIDGLSIYITISDPS